MSAFSNREYYEFDSQEEYWKACDEARENGFQEIDHCHGKTYFARDGELLVLYEYDAFNP